MRITNYLYGSEKWDYKLEVFFLIKRTEHFQNLLHAYYMYYMHIYKPKKNFSVF